MNKALAEQRLASLSMSDMPLIQVGAVQVHISADWFTKYKELRREFMMSLTDSIEELSWLSMDQSEFIDLISGRALPENLTLRLRMPLVFGGKLEISNMFLCKTFPHSHDMDRFIIEQSGAPVLWLPNPGKKVYLPMHNISGGEGGNATGDMFFKYINTSGRE